MSVVTENKGFEIQDESISIALFDFWDYQDLNVRIKMNSKSKKPSSPSTQLPIENLMKEVKPVIVFYLMIDNRDESITIRNIGVFELSGV